VPGLRVPDRILEINRSGEAHLWHTLLEDLHGVLELPRLIEQIRAPTPYVRQRSGEITFWALKNTRTFRIPGTMGFPTIARWVVAGMSRYPLAR
jgi:hypothetical protein